MKIGCDIVEIARIAKEPESFFTKVYTQEELEYVANTSNPYEHLAGFFAAKESFAKALGTGFNGEFSIRDVEVSHKESGEPFYILHGNAAAKIKVIEKVHLSISHEKNYAVAYCVISYED